MAPSALAIAGTSGADLGPCHMTSEDLGHPFSGPVSRRSQVLRDWGFAPQRGNSEAKTTQSEIPSAHVDCVPPHFSGAAIVEHWASCPVVLTERTRLLPVPCRARWPTPSNPPRTTWFGQCACRVISLLVCPRSLLLLELPRLHPYGRGECGDGRKRAARQHVRDRSSPVVSMSDE